jgi:predicted regulator of Ras-like GTPase activity (Roadblock/LC7/MglB family)
MNSMNDVIVKLSSAPGVRGCAIATEDGMMIAHALHGRFDPDVVAGLASFVIATTRRVMLADGYDRLDRFVVHATHGKFVLTDIGNAFLIAITDQFVQLDPVLRTVDSATRKLRELARIK